MTREELLEFHDEITEKCKNTVKKKNNDYTGDKKSPFANFEACEDFDVCSTEQGFMVRALDKMKRINTFIKKGELKVEDEPVGDAIIDIINYMILLGAYLKEQEEDV